MAHWWPQRWAPAKWAINAKTDFFVFVLFMIMIINPSSIKGEYTKNFTSGLFVAHTTTYNYIES